MVTKKTINSPIKSDDSISDKHFISNDGNRNPILENNISNQISLMDLFHILWEGKYIVVLCTILITAAGIIFALTTKEVFSTSSYFIVKTSNKGVGNFSQIAALAGLNIGGNGNVDPSEYLDKIIQDKSFIARLLERKWFYKGDSLFIEQIFDIKPDTTIPDWEYVFLMRKVEKVRKGKILSIKKDAKSGVLTLSAIAPDPQLAYELNLFTLDYISNYIRNSIKSQAKEKKRFIEDRIKESQLLLERSEDKLAKFRSSNLMASSPQVILEESRLLRQVTINQEIFIQLQNQYELVKIEELDDQTLTQVVKGAEVPIQRIKPKRFQIAISSASLGIFLGILIVAILNYKRIISNRDGSLIV